MSYSTKDKIAKLRQARELITQIENWHRGTLACDAQGRRAPVESARACRFCAAGAVRRVCVQNGLFYDLWTELDIAAQEVTRGEHHMISTLNDKGEARQAHGAVLQAFDYAIRSLERKL